MEPIFMTCMVLAFFFSKGKVDTAAYENGKEPPGVAKARMRHDAGGGARTESGKPKGPGALRLLAASRWVNACEAAKQRSDHKAARRRAWYAETAPLKDQQWREKQLRKLNKADRLRERWATDRGLIDLSERRKGEAAEQAGKDKEGRDAEAAVAAATATDPAAAITPADGTPADGTNTPSGNASGTSTDPATEGNPVGDTEPTKPQPAGAAPDGAKKDELVGGWPASGSDIDDEDDEDVDDAAAAEHERLDQKARDVATEKQELREQAKAEAALQQPIEGHVAAAEDWVHRPESAQERKDDPFDNPPPATGAALDLSSKKPANSTTKTEGDSTVYQQAVERLIAAADGVAEYRADLVAFADTLDGKRWGVEVTGPIKDMTGELVALEGDYRDLAARMKHQGDQGAAAHEQAPWVPADDSILV